MTIAEFIEELQEDYDPDVQVESIRMKTSDGVIYFYGLPSSSGGGVTVKRRKYDVSIPHTLSRVDGE